MVWRARNEEYVGEWSADQPHGVGVYSWYTAPTGATVTTETASPSALLVGQYCGEFARGLRHGLGTFSYLNGDR
jgi:hypothetical protein